MWRVDHARMNHRGFGALLSGDALIPSHLQLTFMSSGMNSVANDRSAAQERRPMPTSHRSLLRGPFRGIAWLGGAIAWTAAAAVGAVLALFFAATLVAILFMAGVVVALAAMALRARRTVRAPEGAELIEARNIGGHSWVAYGWDGRR
jgi:hypothetical protein